MNTCVVHPHRPVETGLLCHGCSVALRDNLASIIELWPDVTAMLVPLSRGGSSARSKPGSKPPLNVDVAMALDPRSAPANASQVGRNVAGMMWTVCAELRDDWADDGFTTSAPTSVPAAVQLLLVHVERIAAHPGADVHADEIRTAAKTMRQLAQLTERRWIVGTCTAASDKGADCGGLLQVHVHHRSDWTPSEDWGRRQWLTLACTRCADEWTEADVVALLDARDMMIHQSIATELLGVTERTLRRWVETGKCRGSRGMIAWTDAVATRRDMSATGA